MTEPVPVVDVSPLRDGTEAEQRAVGEAVDRACREHGFLSVVGHGVPEDLPRRLVAEARAFFALDEDEKARIAMDRAGRAWRGWFPFEGEVTGGVPDRKEGLYFGEDLPDDDPRVRAGLPLHGRNLYPDRPAGLAEAVPEYLDALTEVGHRLVAAIGMGLGLGAGWFDEHLTGRPTAMLRVFRYPGPGSADRWGVAEHTDYGLLTLLHQDDVGGLEVHRGDGWIPVDPVPGALVCNLGDMLEAMTGGRYRSTPHRVRSPAHGDRVSVPFFFDPAWDAEVGPLPRLEGEPAAGRPRWDDADVEGWAGRYGDYLLAKVSRVFPDLARGAR